MLQKVLFFFISLIQSHKLLVGTWALLIIADLIFLMLQRYCCSVLLRITCHIQYEKMGLPLCNDQ